LAARYQRLMVQAGKHHNSALCHIATVLLTRIVACWRRGEPYVNGKQFTGRFGKPRPAEVLFERICRKNGIKQPLTRPYSPTTTGKVERWHQSLQTDFLNDTGPFATIAAAQAAVDAWRAEYNTERPHQSLDMATPASRFRPAPHGGDDELQLWAPADLQSITGPPPASDSAATAAKPASWPEAVEVDRVVPPSGNLWVGGQQFWLSSARAGQTVTLWMDTTSVHLSVGGWRVKTVPSRLSEADLARLRRSDARPAGPPPAGPSPGALAASQCVEVDRLVNGIGGVTLLNQLILVGFPLAGQRARLRLDGQVMHVITQDGKLWRTLPCPIPPASGTACRASASLVRPAARRRHHGAAAGLLPWRHHGRQAEDPGRDDPCGQDRHRGLREEQLPAGHRRRHHRRGAPHHQPGDQPLQGLRHPPRKAVTPPMPDMKLDAADAAELAEILQFLSGWLARDPARLGASLDDFVGHPAYGIS
jgi:hypothetical protein